MGWHSGYLVATGQLFDNIAQPSFQAQLVEFGAKVEVIHTSKHRGLEAARASDAPEALVPVHRLKETVSRVCLARMFDDACMANGGGLIAMTFDRYLQPESLAFLQARPAWWNDLITYQFWDAGGVQQPLFLAVRNGYLNAYADGQSILKIAFSRPPRLIRLQAEIHHKYVYDEVKDQLYLKFDGETVTGKLGAGKAYCGETSIDEWVTRSKRHSGPEKRGVAVMLRRNSKIIDVEMGLPGRSADRIDVVALEKSGDALKIVFYEVKPFSSHDHLRKSGQNPPKVMSQMKRYENWIKGKERTEQIIAAYRRTCGLLVEFSKMKNTEIDNLIVRAADEQSNLQVDPKPRLIIFGYTNKEIEPSSSWVKNGHYKKLRESGYKLLMAARPEDVILPDITPSDQWMDESEDLVSYFEGPVALEEVRTAARQNEPDLRMKLQGLAHFAPIFAAPNFKFATWRHEPPDEDGVLQFPYPEHSKEAVEFERAAYALGWVRNYDWSTWLRTPEGRKLKENPGVVACATPEQLGNLLTGCIRSERFCDGAMLDAFESGLLPAIVTRAETLLNELPETGNHSEEDQRF